MLKKYKPFLLHKLFIFMLSFRAHAEIDSLKLEPPILWYVSGQGRLERVLDKKWEGIQKKRQLIVFAGQFRVGFRLSKTHRPSYTLRFCPDPAAPPGIALVLCTPSWMLLS